MKKANNISLLIIFATVVLASCSKMAPLTELNDLKKTSTVEPNAEFKSTAISTASNPNEVDSETITDPDHDTEHDRDKSKPKNQ